MSTDIFTWLHGLTQSSSQRKILVYKKKNSFGINCMFESRQKKTELGLHYTKSHTLPDMLQ